MHAPTALMHFLLQALVVIASSRAIGLIARRFGQPMVIAEIIAGILLGPSLLGWVAPDISATMFPANSMGTLGLVAQIGLVLFMFLVGLELDWSLMKGRAHTSVAISHTSIIVPFLLGIGVAYLIFDSHAPKDVGHLPFALFMGTAMSITAFPVLARLLTERRLLRTRVGAVTIACAAVDDVTAWCILAFVIAATRTAGYEDAFATTGLALAYILFMFFVIRPLIRRVAARVTQPEKMSQNVVALVVSMAMVSAWVTELIGIHALFGAFAMGSIIPKTGGFARALAEKLEDVVSVVLLPLFFAYSGLRTEIGLLNSADEWLITGGIIVAACAGKFGGSMLAARFTGLSWRESSALGILMNTRGLMELVVLNIGLDLGVITPTVFSMMVVMALVTTFLTTPVLSWIYPPAVMARDLLDHVPTSTHETPRPVAARTVHSRILACVSNPSTGPGLATLAAAISGRDRTDARVFALHLAEPSERGSFQIGQLDRLGGRDLASEVESTGAAEAANVLAPLEAHARALALSVKPMSFLSAEPAKDICRVAEVRNVDLVLLGWHKPIISQTHLGGVVHEVLQETDQTVGILFDRGFEAPRRILVPFIGQPRGRGLRFVTDSALAPDQDNDMAALRLAAIIAERSGAELTVLGVERENETLARPSEAPPDAHYATVKASWPSTFGLAHGPDPAEVVLDYSRRGFDLIIVGLGRDWGLPSRRLPLSLAIHPERFLRDTPTSVLVVRDARRAPVPVVSREEAATEPVTQ